MRSSGDRRGDSRKEASWMKTIRQRLQGSHTHVFPPVQNHTAAQHNLFSVVAVVFVSFLFVLLLFSSANEVFLLDKTVLGSLLAKKVLDMIDG